VVERTDNAEGSAIDNMGIHHGRSHVLVPEQRLNCSDVGPCLKQVRREAVAECMACGSIGEPCRSSSLLHSPLHGRCVEVVKDLSAGVWIGARPRRGKQILPSEAFRGARHFLAQRMRQVDLTAARGKLRLVAPRDEVELGTQLVARAGRQQRRPVIEDAFVEEEQGTKSLILRGRRSTAFHGQFVQVCGHFFSAHLPWMFSFVKADKLTDPVDVRLFRACGVVQAKGRRWLAWVLLREGSYSTAA